MAGPRNPSTLSWRHDGKNTDGSAFDATRFGGWELDVNGTGMLSVPLGWETDGEYQAPIAELNLPEGDYSLRLRLVTNEDIPSAYSAPVAFEIRKVPNGPLDFSVA